MNYRKLIVAVLGLASLSTFAQVSDLKQSTEVQTSPSGSVRTEKISATVKMTREQIKDMNKKCWNSDSFKRSLCQMDYRVQLAKKSAKNNPKENPLDTLNDDVKNAAFKKKSNKRRKIACSFSQKECKKFQKKINSCPDQYSDKKCKALATYDVMTPNSVKTLCSHADKLACSLYAKTFMGCYVKNKGSVENLVKKCDEVAHKYSSKFEKVSKNFKKGSGEIFDKLNQCLNDQKLDVFDKKRIANVCSRSKDSAEAKQCEKYFTHKNSKDMNKCVDDTNKYMAKKFSNDLSLEKCSEMANGSNVVICNGFQYKLTDNVLNQSRKIGKFLEKKEVPRGPAGSSSSAISE